MGVKFCEAGLSGVVEDEDCVNHCRKIDGVLFREEKFLGLGLEKDDQV